MLELKRLREERGMTQRQLAEASGVDRATINQAERGRRMPRLDTLESLADALDVEVADLFPKAQPELWRASMARAGEVTAWSGEKGVLLAGIGPPELYSMLEEVERGERSAEEAMRELVPGFAAR